MERITRRSADGKLYAKHTHAQVLSRLAEYEDAEEQGRLFVIPCKLGNTLYRIIENRPSRERPLGAVFVRPITLNKNNFCRIVLGGEFGKTVFLTREEAEDALEGGEFG